MIPIGEDAYLMWDRLPYQRIGVRAYMRSTYDRDGNNRTADAGHFLYQESDSFNVALDVRGEGTLYFKRTNHFHGSPWHYEVDGRDFIVKESATDDPIGAKEKYAETVFLPQRLFPHPLTWTWTTTKGADLMWVPLSFEKSLRIAYSRTFYGTGYYIYHLLIPGMKNLSRPLESWSQNPPDARVLRLLERAGTDILPPGKSFNEAKGKISLSSNTWQTLVRAASGPGMIRSIEFKVPREAAYEFGKCRLRVTWDDRWYPSIDAPIALFFGAGHLHNNDDREYLVRGFPLAIRYDKEVTLSCFWPMPFFRNAHIELRGAGGEVRNVHWRMRSEPYSDPLNHVAYFHATYTDHPHPVPGKDNIFLDTAVAEGGGLWSGHFVGMSWIFTREGNLRTLEGDPRFFFDDSRTPQAWGTGTEEWGGGGDYWGGRNMTIPLAGHPVGTGAKDAKTKLDSLNSAYRFLIADTFPFGRRAVIGLEHGGVNTIMEHYSGVTYWYGIDDAALVLTDQLNVCNAEDSRIHGYQSPTAEMPYALVSRYELGPDRDIDEWSNPTDAEKQQFNGSEMYFPAEEDSVRVMTGASEFMVDIDPNNLGVLLRRKFDYGYPNQQAKVYVRDAEKQSTWQLAGEWYTAGSNTCVYSRPQGRNFSEAELSPTEHNIISSNRRWREEEFLLPIEMTHDVRKLGIRIQFVPNQTELFPGRAFPERTAWSESRYWVYCYRMPVVDLD